jgi:periplasmic copper chaperone A
MIIRYLRAFAILALLAATSPASADTELQVSEPWIREAPPTSRVLAGYLTLVNTSDNIITVTAISSPDFENAEIHRTVIEDGVARMLPVKQLEVPANGQLALEPGGHHLMLFDPRRPLTEGETVTLVIQRNNGEQITTSAPVIRKTGEDHSHHHH